MRALRGELVSGTRWSLKRVCADVHQVSRLMFFVRMLVSAHMYIAFAEVHMNS